MFILFLFLCDRVSLCSPSCPGICSVDEAGLELIEMCLPQPSSAGIKGVHHHHSAISRCV